MNPYPFAPLNHFTVPFSLTENSFHFVKNCSPDFPIVIPANRDAPSGKTLELGCTREGRRNLPKNKRPLGLTHAKKLRRKPSEPSTIDVDFYDPTQDVNLPCNVIAAAHTGLRAHAIISTIKSFDKKN
jgi:hypothetical protein